jgi:hypothetical protein
MKLNKSERIEQGARTCPQSTSTRQPPRRPSSTSPGLPTSGLAARSSLAKAPTSTSRCITGAARRPTSRKARAAYGNACTTTGPIPTASPSRPPTPTCGGASGHTYTFTRQPNGTTDIDVVVVRDGKNLKGWGLGFVLGTIGRRVLERAFENSVKAIEARNNTTEHLATGNSSLAA